MLFLFFNRALSTRTPELTEWFFRRSPWSTTTKSSSFGFLELEHKKNSFFRELEGQKTPSGEYHGSSRKCVGTYTVCQQCGSNPAVLRCRDCLPRPLFCDKCDVIMHTRYVLHNRRAMTAGFFQPLPPTTYIVNKTLCHDGKFCD